MKECLEISVKLFKDGIIYYQVVNQRYRGKEFFDSRNYFVSHTYNKLKLVSTLLPIFTDVQHHVCFQGNMRDRDDRMIRCTLADYIEILQAVKEYNLERSKEEEKKQEHERLEIIKKELFLESVDFVNNGHINKDHKSKEIEK